MFDASTDIIWSPSAEEMGEAWFKAQNSDFSNFRVWNDYLGFLAAGAMLSWIGDDPRWRLSWANTPQDIGVALSIEDTTTSQCWRLALLSSEACDRTELRLAQCWVDEPRWAADYYLTVQVDVQRQWTAIWGYTTHAILMDRATLSKRDHTYSLDAAALFDPTALLVALQLCPNESTKARVQD